MISVETNRLVEDYLRRLEEAAAHLQPARRTELVAEIREHIDAALRAEDEADEVAVRNVLERLGPPEEIAEAAEPAPEDEARVGKLEVTALIALVVPVLGWLVGIVLVLCSRAWSSREKLVGIALALLPVLVPLVGLVAESEGVDVEPVPVEPGPTPQPAPGPNELPDDATNDADLGTVEVVVLLALFLAGLPSALYLGLRLRRI
jgi:hypothetical protein